MKADRGKLELAMARSCMSTDELVIKAELPLSTLKNVITGRSVRPVTLGKVARALGVDPDYLLVKEPPISDTKPKQTNERCL